MGGDTFVMRVMRGGGKSNGRVGAVRWMAMPGKSKQGHGCCGTARTASASVVFMGEGY